jgi:hypothetical protein
MAERFERMDLVECVGGLKESDDRLRIFWIDHHEADGWMGGNEKGSRAG